MNYKKFSFIDRGRSFQYAWQGVRDFMRTQHNAIVHALATVAVAICGCMVNVSGSEWTILLLAIAAVWAAEIFNTAIEKLCDVVSPQRDERIRLIKDLAAAGVLITSIAAAAAGLIIFIPKFI